MTPVLSWWHSLQAVWSCPFAEAVEEIIIEKVRELIGRTGG